MTYYGYCGECWSLTPLDTTGDRVCFDCASCGAHNEDAPVYICCPYQYCGKFLRVEPPANGEADPIVYGSVSSGVRTLSENPMVSVLYVSGIMHRSPDGDTFELTSAERGVEHIDRVDMSKNDGACALLIEDSEGIVRSSLYFEPEYWANGEPPVLMDRMPVSFTLRLPDDAGELIFYHTVPGNGGTEGWMEYGGWRMSLSDLG